MRDQSQISDKDLLQLTVEEEDFRSSIGTMDKKGKRQWVFPKKPKGRYTNYRT